MPKSNKDLAYSQQHVLERALERYNLELTADDYRILNETVRRAQEPDSGDGGKVTPGADETSATDTSWNVSPESGSVTKLNDEGDEQIWGVPWGVQTLLCVWTISMGRVTTLLPEGTAITRRKGTKVRKGKK